MVVAVVAVVVTGCFGGPRAHPRHKQPHKDPTPAELVIKSTATVIGLFGLDKTPPHKPPRHERPMGWGHPDDVGPDYDEPDYEEPEAKEGDTELATVPSVDVDIDLPKTSMKNPDAIAVVIGNSNYKMAKNVDYATNDAEVIKRYLVEVLGYSEGNIFYLTDATKGDFEIHFGNSGNHKGKLFNAVKADKSDVFVYYSGHGAPGLKDRKGYFVPVEADPQYMELGGYSTDVFYENLSKIPARSVTVVLDACFSGATIYDNISPMVLEIENPAISIKNGVVLSSSRGTQVSSWYNEKRHGIFTYFFLKAMHNRNADLDGDGTLTFDEVYTYISDKTEGVPYYARRLHGVEQTPTIEGQFKDKVLIKY